MKEGFYLIDKPAGWTSFDVCNKMRSLLDIRKIGHTGTLDPFATGLLIIGVGKATKLIRYLEKERKTYEAQILLGKTSETLDPDSEVIDTGFSGMPPTKKTLEKVLKDHFSGTVQQVPPKYSAIKIQGQRAHQMTRKGEKVDLKPRETEVFSLKILDYNFPSLTLELEVAAGFYVRSFARDLGEKVAGGGLCQRLRRTHVGDLSVEDAETLETLTMPIDPSFILRGLDHRDIPTGRIQDFMAGRAFPMSGKEGETVLVLCGGKTFGVGEFRAGKLQPRVVL